MRKTAAVVMIALFAAAGVWAAETTRWINVHVTEPGTETNVEVHLPLSLVTSIVQGIEVDKFKAGKIDLEIDDAEIDWEQILAAVIDAPDGDFVRAKTDDADVEVVKRDNMMLIHVTEKNGENAVVDVRVPMSLVGAFSVDDDNQIDVMPILKGLAELPDGELVKVTSDDANVRIWIE